MRAFKNTDQEAEKKTEITGPQAGVTLVELMVVLVIIGLLAAVVVVNVIPAQDEARVTKAKADIASLENALKMYRLDNLSYPTTEQGLEALVAQPDGLDRPSQYRDGGYIDSLPKDPWGTPYQYVRPGEHGAYDLYSLGADGRLGGEDLNKDIGNWQDETDA